MAQFKSEDKANINFIADAIREIHSYVGEKDYAGFSKDENCVEQVVQQLQHIGGAAKMLSDEFKDFFNSVNWEAMVNLENVSLSPEFETGNQVIWGIVKEDLPYIDDKITQVNKTIESEEGLEE